MEGAKWSREFQASGMSGDLLEDAEGADPLVIELLHRTLGRDIACVKPCEVVDFEGSRYRVASIFGRKHILFDLGEWAMALPGSVQIPFLMYNIHCYMLQAFNTYSTHIKICS